MRIKEVERWREEQRRNIGGKKKEYSDQRNGDLREKFKRGSDEGTVE